MGFKKLYDSLKRCRSERKNYRIHPTVIFMVDTHDYLFSFLPTIHWMPWTYRYLGSTIIDITWLHLHIGIGEWVRKENQDETVEP